MAAHNGALWALCSLLAEDLGWFGIDVELSRVQHPSAPTVASTANNNQGVYIVCSSNEWACIGADRWALAKPNVHVNCRTPDSVRRERFCGSVAPIFVKTPLSMLHDMSYHFLKGSITICSILCMKLFCFLFFFWLLSMWGDQGEWIMEGVQSSTYPSCWRQLL